VVHDGIVEIEDYAAGPATQERKQGSLKALPLEEKEIICGKVAEEVKVFAQASRVKSHGRFDALFLQMRQVVQHTIAACCHFPTLDEKQNLHAFRNSTTKHAPKPLQQALQHD
jgi:hypothetical protein